MKKQNLLILLSSLLLLTSCGTKTYPYKDYECSLTMKDSFKIMQLTDLHIAVESNLRDVKKIIKQDIDEAQPDLIVITGDTFMDATKSLVDETLEYINSFNIKFAFTYGNHDLQGFYHRFYINDKLKTLSNAVFKDYNDDDIYGLTNYYININKNGVTKYRLFIIDSNGYYNYSGVGKFGYDIIHDDQIDHVTNIAAGEGIVPSLAFFHIPLYEYEDAYKLYLNKEIVGTGENRESVSSSYKRTDAFTRLKAAGVKGIFVGHDHINYTNLIYEETILAYGIKSSYEIYNDKDIVGYTLISLDGTTNFDLNNIQNVRKEFVL